MGTCRSENNQYDERGQKILTREGFTGYVYPSIKDYFFEQYEKQEWRVIPWHWPTMQTKEDVDNWIKSINELMESVEENK